MAEKIDKSDKLSEINNVIDESTAPYYDDTYKPWQTKEQLRVWLEVEWTTWDPRIETHTHDWTENNWVKISYNNLIDTPDDKYYQKKHTEWAGAYGAWSFTITTWFRPKRIEIRAARKNAEWTSIWTVVVDETESIKNWCAFVDWSFTNVWDITEAYCINIKSTSLFTPWWVTNITDTWFVIYIQNNNWSFNALITAEW